MTTLPGLALNHQQPTPLPKTTMPSPSTTPPTLATKSTPQDQSSQSPIELIVNFTNYITKLPFGAPPGPLIIWTSQMHFYMVHLMKQSTCDNLQDSLIHLSCIMCASSTSPCMHSNKLYELGLNIYEKLSCNLASKNQIQTSPCFSITRIIFIIFYSVCRQHNSHSLTQHVMTKVLHYLDSKFAVKHLGKLHYSLGVEAHQNAQGLLLTQTKYIKDLLAKTNMTQAKVVITPTRNSNTAPKTSTATLFDATVYRQVVGSLKYLQLTQSKLRFATNLVAQFVHDHKTLHWETLKCILCYLVDTAMLGLQLIRSCSHDLNIYYDADWGGSMLDRKSATCLAIFLGHNLIL